MSLCTGLRFPNRNIRDKEISLVVREPEPDINRVYQVNFNKIYNFFFFTNMLHVKNKVISEI